MKVPWLTPILGAISDGKIAAMLEKQVVHLEREKDEALLNLKNAEAKIGDLESQLKKLTPKSDIAVEATQVLQRFSEHGCELSADQIGGITGIKIGKVIHHFGSLRSLGFIRQSRARSSDSEPPFRITPKGSSFLVEHGML